MNDDLIRKYNDVRELALKTGSESIKCLSDSIDEYIEHISGTVTFAGSRGSGKSALINAVTGCDFLVSSPAASGPVVTEIQIDQSVSEPVYYVLGENDSYEKTDRESFENSFNDDICNDNTDQFAVRSESIFSELDGIRFFDLSDDEAPEYMSYDRFSHIISESDMIVYAVSYRAGFQLCDHQYLKKIYECAGECACFVLIINRCSGHPKAEDKRITEIKGYVSDIIHTEPEVFTVSSQKLGISRPMTAELRDAREYISGKMRSCQRKEMVTKICENYISDLFFRCDYEIHHRIALANRNKAEDGQKTENIAIAIEKFIFEEIVPTYEQLELVLHTKINSYACEMSEKLIEEIDKSEYINMDQMIPFIEKHMLPFMADEKISELKYYIEVQLKYLNKKMNSYLDSKIADLDNDLPVISDSVYDMPEKDYRIKITSMALSRSFSKYVTVLGGSGSAIAGAASHTLRSIGEFLSNTFASETHSALSVALRHIGTSSVSALTGAGVALTELTSVAIEYSTWKYKMKKRVIKTIEEWRSNLSETMTDELEKLKDKNITILKSCISQYLDVIYCDKPGSDELLKQLEKLEEKYDFK